MLLVLLMTLSLFAACKDKDKDNDQRETERETEKETERVTEQELSAEEREQLKVQMSESILQALSNVEQPTEPETQGQTNAPSTSPSTPPSQGSTSSDYAGVVEGLLGSLGGLVNDDYDLFGMIIEVLDLYLGTNSTSEFILELIKSWIDDKIEQNKKTEESNESIEIDTSLPENSGLDLQEFIANKTAVAVADAIVDRIDDLAGNKMPQAIYDSIHNSVYDSVYNAMIDDEGYMDSLLEEMIPGYGQLSGILGALGQ